MKLIAKASIRLGGGGRCEVYDWRRDGTPQYRTIQNEIEPETEFEADDERALDLIRTGAAVRADGGSK